MGRRVSGCDFGFLVAGAYSGFVIWASGLSSSIALASATAGSEMNFIERLAGQVPGLRETLLSPMNLALLLSTLATLPLMFWLMRPRGAQVRAVDPARLEEAEAATGPSAALWINETPVPRTPAQRLEQSRLLLYAIVALGAVFLVRHFATRGFALDLNVVILLFLVPGMVLHGRPAAYVQAFNQAARVVGPLALQYPLYGGIMGMMQHSGLADVVSQWFVAVSTSLTFPFFCYLSSIVISLFIPSGGGHWVVQGPFVVPAAVKLGVSPAASAMAVAFGEQTANMVQPFWALPVLAVANLSIREIMGYCVMTFLLSCALTTLVLFWLA